MSERKKRHQVKHRFGRGPTPMPPADDPDMWATQLAREEREALATLDPIDEEAEAAALERLARDMADAERNAAIRANRAALARLEAIEGPCGGEPEVLTPEDVAERQAALDELNEFRPGEVTVTHADGSAPTVFVPEDPFTALPVKVVELPEATHPDAYYVPAPGDLPRAYPPSPFAGIVDDDAPPITDSARLLPERAESWGVNIGESVHGWNINTAASSVCAWAYCDVLATLDPAEVKAVMERDGKFPADDQECQTIVCGDEEGDTSEMAEKYPELDKFLNEKLT